MPAGAHQPFGSALPARARERWRTGGADQSVGGGTPALRLLARLGAAVAGRARGESQAGASAVAQAEAASAQAAEEEEVRKPRPGAAACGASQPRVDMGFHL